MGSLATEEEQDHLETMFTESELPPFLTSASSNNSLDSWHHHHHHTPASSIFSDCSTTGLSHHLKDWSLPNSLPLSPLPPGVHDHTLYIDPCCSDFGDVFFTTDYQTTPISVLDYVQSEPEDGFSAVRGFHHENHQQQQQQQEHQQQQDGGMEMEELLAGYGISPQLDVESEQQEGFVDEHRVESLAGELQGEIGHFGNSSFPGEIVPVVTPGGSSRITSCSSPSQGSYGVSGSVSSGYQVSIKSEPVFINPKTEQSDHTSHDSMIIPKQEEMVELPNFYHHHQQNQHPFLPPPKFEPVDRQLRLVRMLLSCANAVADENLDLAGAILIQLRGMVVPHGSPMERLASYVTEALVARLSRNTRSSSFKGLDCDKLQQLSSTTRTDMLEAFWAFYEYIPIGKFTHLTMNQILLEASERERMIHVVDFQVWYGAQWPAFIQSLAMRPGGPPILRMTAVGSSDRDLQEAGSKLLDCARSLQVPFEYCIVHVELDRFDARMIELREGEAVLVNSLCQFHCFLKRDPAFLDQFLMGLKSLRPKLVVMAENDADHNSPVFLNRFMSCLQYYSAVFDAFDASLHMPGILQSRKKLEELMAAQKLRNMIACEGSERVERHESMRGWNGRMSAVGFRAVSMSHKAVNQANLLLKLYFSNGYTLTNQDGFLILGWRGMPLNGVGAWI